VSFDLTEFARKLRSYRDQRQLTSEELATGTGIVLDRFEGLAAGELLPTGDEVLIIADFFQCDYRLAGFVGQMRTAGRTRGAGHQTLGDCRADVNQPVTRAIHELAQFAGIDHVFRREEGSERHRLFPRC
jgi:transcriptional regulator with XRE-family HTH domain